MSSLKDALKTNTSKGNTSSKNPAYYTREKNEFVKDMASNFEPIVRIAAAGNEHIPVKVLTGMLDTETDVDVLRIILMNPRTPIKSINSFITNKPELTILFDDDEEVTDYLKSRVKPESDDSVE